MNLRKAKRELVLSTIYVALSLLFVAFIIFVHIIITKAISFGDSLNRKMFAVLINMFLSVITAPAPFACIMISFENLTDKFEAYEQIIDRRIKKRDRRTK